MLKSFCENVLVGIKVLSNIWMVPKALTISVKERVSAQPPFCKECIKDKLSYHEVSKLQKKGCLHSKVAILFSGGLDSTVLVYLAALSVKPGDQLDLLNVAFQQADGTYHGMFLEWWNRTKSLSSILHHFWRLLDLGISKVWKKLNSRGGSLRAD